MEPGMSLPSGDSQTMGRVQPEATGQLEFGTTQMKKKKSSLLSFRD